VFYETAKDLQAMEDDELFVSVELHENNVAIGFPRVLMVHRKDRFRDIYRKVF
jgi:hypothetical protein